MAKLILGKTPANFKPFDVKFILPDGQDDQINVTYKYMTRSQYATFLNDLYSEADEPKPGAEEKIDFEKLFAKGGKKIVGQLSKIIVDWDFAEKPTSENLHQMHDQAPAAAAAITAAFAAACTEGKLGN